MAGVAALFTKACYQLGRRGVLTLQAGLEPLEWLALAVLMVVFVYGEGERALGRRWIPHMVSRARELGPHSPMTRRILAPLYAMSLIGAPTRSLVRAWIGLALVILAVVIVRHFAEPWRGIVDLAVVGALAWGLVRLTGEVSRRTPAPRP